MTCRLDVTESESAAHAEFRTAEPLVPRVIFILKKRAFYEFITLFAAAFPPQNASGLLCTAVSVKSALKTVVGRILSN